jgi:hypothetical protein
MQPEVHVQEPRCLTHPSYYTPSPCSSLAAQHVSTSTHCTQIVQCSMKSYQRAAMLCASHSSGCTAAVIRCAAQMMAHHCEKSLQEGPSQQNKKKQLGISSSCTAHTRNARTNPFWSAGCNPLQP